MTIGEIVRLRILPEETWEVIEEKYDGFFLRNTESNMGIWAREEEIQRDKNISSEDFFKSIDIFA